LTISPRRDDVDSDEFGGALKPGLDWRDCRAETAAASETATVMAETKRRFIAFIRRAR
jgi:hypothetical protein